MEFITILRVNRLGDQIIGENEKEMDFLLNKINECWYTENSGFNYECSIKIYIRIIFMQFFKLIIIPVSTSAQLILNLYLNILFEVRLLPFAFVFY